MPIARYTAEALLRLERDNAASGQFLLDGEAAQELLILAHHFPSDKVFHIAFSPTRQILGFVFVEWIAYFRWYDNYIESVTLAADLLRDVENRLHAEAECSETRPSKGIYQVDIAASVPMMALDQAHYQRFYVHHLSRDLHDPVIPQSLPAGVRLGYLDADNEKKMRAVYELFRLAQDEVGYSLFEYHTTNDFEEWRWFYSEVYWSWIPMWFTAWADDELVGICLFWQERESDPKHDYGFIYALYVHPDWRGKGLGSSLLQRSFRLFRDERGVATVKGNVKSDLAPDSYPLVGWCGLRIERSSMYYQKELHAQG